MSKFKKEIIEAAWRTFTGRVFISVIVDEHTVVPTEYIRQGILGPGQPVLGIVLNISANAIHAADLNDHVLSFRARFNKTDTFCSIPLENISEIFSPEDNNYRVGFPPPWLEETADGTLAQNNSVPGQPDAAPLIHRVQQHRHEPSKPKECPPVEKQESDTTTTNVSTKTKTKRPSWMSVIDGGKKD